eukprot:TRINITY_DN27437_c0_g1_i1.p2 TRINITY_DN27437_c0_g1~~TRINITY_DN27437_c0_g1_i1.p2  ORF type:complete len:101 (-),score=14.31 TRINITY_DN27437_c0_g1_i1:59-361(-)
MTLLKSNNIGEQLQPEEEANMLRKTSLHSMRLIRLGEMIRKGGKACRLLGVAGKELPVGHIWTMFHSSSYRNTDRYRFQNIAGGIQTKIQRKDKHAASQT